MCFMAFGVRPETTFGICSAVGDTLPGSIRSGDIPQWNSVLYGVSSLLVVPTGTLLSMTMELFGCAKVMIRLIADLTQPRSTERSSLSGVGTAIRKCVPFAKSAGSLVKCIRGWLMYFCRSATMRSGEMSYPVAFTTLPNCANNDSPTYPTPITQTHASRGPEEREVNGVASPLVIDLRTPRNFMAKANIDTRPADLRSKET